MLRVLVHVRHDFSLWTLPESYLDELRRDFPQVEFQDSGKPDGFDRQLSNAEVLFGWGLSAENFSAARRLRWVQATAAGVQRLLFPAMVESEVTLTNARGLLATPIAEHVLAVILGFARKLHLARDAQKLGRWEQETLWGRPPALRELGDSTLGLIGVGSIGRAVARRARALGMTVIGLRRRAEPASELDELLPAERLLELLGRSHYVVLSVPSTPATTGLIGEHELAAMREDSVLVNVGRGDVVDEATLLGALERGRPAGAALDVFAEEPLPASSPFYRLPQVWVTPHLAGATPHYWPRVIELFRDNLTRYLDGRPLRNVVDKHAGY